MKKLKDMSKKLMITLLCLLVVLQVALPVAYAAETGKTYLEKRLIGRKSG